MASMEEETDDAQKRRGQSMFLLRVEDRVRAKVLGQEKNRARF